MSPTDAPPDATPTSRSGFLVRLVALLLTAVVAVLLAGAPPAAGDEQQPGAGSPGDGAFGEPTGRRTPTNFEFPVRPGRVVRGYSPPPEPWLSGHRGVDLAATASADVFAAGPGRIVFAGMVAGRPVISIDHAGGIRTTYEPALSDVIVGEEVESGQKIGTVFGLHPECAAASCLHWGARWSADPDGYIDPLSLLGLQSRPIVLKPVEE